MRGTAVGGVCEIEKRGPPRLPKIPVEILEAGRASVDVVLISQANFYPEAHQVRFGQFDARAVFSARPRYGKTGQERPEIPGPDTHIDHAILVPDWHDLGVIQITVLAQDSFRLLQQPPRKSISAAKQKLFLDGRVTRDDVPAIGKPIQCVVLTRHTRVEHVLLIEDDATDNRT